MTDLPSPPSFQVSWKPVFRTWGLEPGRGPSIWKHYAAGTTSKCTLSEILCGDAVCTVVASGCSIRTPWVLMRIQTYEATAAVRIDEHAVQVRRRRRRRMRGPCASTSSKAIPTSED